MAESESEPLQEDLKPSKLLPTDGLTVEATCPGDKTSDFTLTMPSKLDSSEKTTNLEEIPGIKQSRKNLGWLLCFSLLIAFVCLFKLQMLPLCLYYSVKVDNSWKDFFILVIDTGLFFSLLFILASVFLEFSLILGLFQYIWLKVPKHADIEKWDYITDTLKSMTFYLTNFSVVLLFLLCLLYYVFIRYDNLTLSYVVGGNVTSTASQNLNDFLAYFCICITVKFWLFALIEYFRIVFGSSFDRAEKYRTKRRMIKQQEKLEKLSQVNDGNSDQNGQNRQMSSDIQQEKENNAKNFVTSD